MSEKRLKPTPPTPSLEPSPPAPSYCLDERGGRGWTFLNIQVWGPEAPNIEPQRYSKSELAVLDLAVILSVSVGIHLLPMYGLCCLEGTVPRGSLRPQGLGHPPGQSFPNFLTRRRLPLSLPAVSSCHSNLLVQRDGPQGRGQKDIPLFSQAKGQVGTAGGKIARPFTVLPGR